MSCAKVAINVFFTREWQFLESLCEDKFVKQLGALHIKDMCPLIIPNLMVAPSQ